MSKSLIVPERVMGISGTIRPKGVAVFILSLLLSVKPGGLMGGFTGGLIGGLLELIEVKSS
ncbi:MAG: hypothetical protein F6K18_33325 [Okeania sp. SIO2C2]|nr:hypothetical protein [Okeania sp. SIO2C2]